MAYLSWSQILRRPGSKKITARRLGRYRPLLERLEDRLVPATRNWTGLGDNVSPLDMQTNVSVVNVSGGLTLKGAVVRLGNAVGTTFGQIFVIGAAQTIDGVAGSPGTLLFGGSTGSALFSQGGSVVTLGA